MQPLVIAGATGIKIDPDCDRAMDPDMVPGCSLVPVGTLTILMSLGGRSEPRHLCDHWTQAMDINTDSAVIGPWTQTCPLAAARVWMPPRLQGGPQTPAWPQVGSQILGSHQVVTCTLTISTDHPAVRPHLLILMSIHGC